ncbi:MAG: GNAT family N-acetyltransferase [Acidobacteriota bacterium]
MQVTDRAWIRQRLRADPALHLYELGDLDDFFWPHTRWYARGDATALVYTASELPVLVALGGAEHAALLAELRDVLPARVYAHLSPGLVARLAPRFADEPHGEFLKMILADPAAVPAAAATRLGPADRDELVAFYAHAYPANWFDPRMLETGQYFAIREGGAIVAAGGIHVYSPAERVAALGNIAVAPAARGRGLARRVTAAVCRSLLRDCDHVGLNVRADNAAAIACYTRLGFAHHAPYEEHLLVAD